MRCLERLDYHQAEISLNGVKDAVRKNMRDTSANIVIVAVMHFSREPGYWKHRIEMS